MTTTQTTTPAPVIVPDVAAARAAYRQAFGPFVDMPDFRTSDEIAREANAAHAARWGTDGDDTDLYDTDAAELNEQDAADDRNED